MYTFIFIKSSAFFFHFAAAKSILFTMWMKLPKKNIYVRQKIVLVCTNVVICHFLFIMVWNVTQGKLYQSSTQNLEKNDLYLGHLEICMITIYTASKKCLTTCFCML